MQSATDMFNAMSHKKNTCVTMKSALPNKNGLISWDCTSAASISAGVTVLRTAQLLPFRSNKPALDDQEMTWIQDMKSKPMEGRTQSDPISVIRRWFYLWTGHSTSERRPQRNDCGKQTFRLIQLFPKITSMQGLMEVQRWLWSQPWQESTDDQRAMFFLKILSTFLHVLKTRRSRSCSPSLGK